MPTAESASSPRSASLSRSRKSTSWSVGGAPRAHAAMPPPSSAGTPASESAATARFAVATRAGRYSFWRRPMRPGTRPAVFRNTAPGTSAVVERALRIAAVGDIHSSEEHRERLADAFAAVDECADLVLLAGDLTTHGLPDEAAVLADACRTTRAPVLAVLGNHDHHSGRADE